MLTLKAEKISLEVEAEDKKKLSNRRKKKKKIALQNKYRRSVQIMVITKIES